MNDDTYKIISQQLSNSMKATNALGELCRRQNEVLKKMTPALTEITNSYGGMLSSLNNSMAPILNKNNSTLNAIREISQRMSKMVSPLSQINIPKITIPKINIPSEYIQTLKRLAFLAYCKQVEWPLFFIYEEGLVERLRPYFNESNSTQIPVSRVIIDYFDEAGINNITDYWFKRAGVHSKRYPLLKEAVKLYEVGAYYGCVSIIMCQILGIISDTYKTMLENGIEFSAREVEEFFKGYNSGKTLNKGTVEAINKGKVGREKIQLLCVATDIDSGVLLWEASLDYLYNIVFTSDEMMDESEHVCRNKICHGVQCNYGDQEHALKAILSMDIITRLSALMEASLVSHEM